jgi:CheY-like chemotaxis protein
MNPDQGWQLIAMLRLEPTTSTIPILICSTDPSIPKQKAETLAKLNCYYVEKPFNLDTLLEMLATIIDASAPR